jgi:hypothetical protein
MTSLRDLATLAERARFGEAALISRLVIDAAFVTVLVGHASLR